MISCLLEQMTKYIRKKTLSKMCDSIQYDLHKIKKTQHTTNIFNDECGYLKFKKNNNNNNNYKQQQEGYCDKNQLELAQYIEGKNNNNGLQIETNNNALEMMMKVSSMSISEISPKSEKEISSMDGNLTIPMKKEGNETK
eukprot:389071_1